MVVWRKVAFDEIFFLYIEKIWKACSGNVESLPEILFYSRWYYLRVENLRGAIYHAIGIATRQVKLLYINCWLDILHFSLRLPLVRGEWNGICPGTIFLHTELAIHLQRNISWARFFQVLDLDF